jgi:4-alpha-glucanotransferase
LIAEDLGLIDEPVRELLEATGLPGMKVLQFAFGDGPNNLYLPHRHVERSVVYTGTHDNETTRGWWEGLDDELRQHVSSYLKHIEQEGPAWGLIRAALASVASVAIIPAQDLLNLDNGARMNCPGVAEGNWRWRLRAGELSGALALSFGQLNHI